MKTSSALWIIYLGVLALGRAASIPDVAIVAHRGGARLAPENTLLALERGAAAARFVEFDVQTSKDGRLVIIHDEKLERTTDGRGLVAEKLFDELRQLDAGKKFKPEYAGLKIPEFHEALETVLRAGATPFIDCKACEPRALVTELRRLNATRKVLVNSSDYKFLQAVHALAPEIKLAGTASVALPEKELGEYVDRFKQAGADMLWWEAFRLPAGAVKFFHRRGFRVYAWTVNDPAEMTRLIAAGVDGILTDDPVAMQRALSAGR